MARCIDVPDFAPEDTLQRKFLSDQYNVAAELSRRRRDLAPDEPGTDDQNSWMLLQPLPEVLAIAQRPKIMDALKLVSGNGQAARRRAGRQQEFFVGDSPAIRRFNAALGGIDPHHR